MSVFCQSARWLAAQIKAMSRLTAHQIRMAQYREMAAFSQFARISTSATQRLLARAAD